MIRTLLYSSFSYIRPPRHFTSLLGRRSLSRLDDTPRSNSGSTQPTSWLTRTVLSSPKAQTLFLQLSRLLGYNSVKQVAGRRALFMYQALCSSRADEEAEFWRNVCHLPPTFQSWFTVTNLHVWLLTVRFRALPPPDGNHFVQAFIDHFFMDVESRIRFVLQPSSQNATPTHSLYYASSIDTSRIRRAPEALVTRQMKIFKEQWSGMGMAFDLGLVEGDMEIAGAVWRNLLGARGARGIVCAPSTTSHQHFRRSVNLVGGSDDAVKNIEEKGLEVEETRDDQSGVHDFLPDEADKYLEYPQTMLDLVGYVRKELARLEAVSDEMLTSGDLGNLKFGRVKEP